MANTLSPTSVLTMTCPSCGAKLKVSAQVHLLMCANCGNEYMVHRDEGAIYLGPIAQDVRQIRVGVDKTAAELAVVRLTKDLAELEQQCIATKSYQDSHWVGDGGGVKALVVIGFVALAVGLCDAGQSLLLFVGLITFVVCIGFAIKKHDDRSGEARWRRETELKRLESERSTKSQQLRKNRQIAES